MINPEPGLPRRHENIVPTTPRGSVRDARESDLGAQVSDAVCGDFVITSVVAAREVLSTVAGEADFSFVTDCVAPFSVVVSSGTEGVT